jgi:hypothetical protein
MYFQQGFSKAMAGYRNQNVPHVIETGFQVQFGTKVFRKAHAGQVMLVGAIVGNFLQVRGITVPYPDEAAAAGEL